MDITYVARRQGQMGMLKRSTSWMAGSVKACFAAMVIGQLAFVLFIALFYYPPTLSGNFASWNNKPLITGHVTGDSMGNLTFAVHVLAAALMTASGWLQLIPAIRRQWTTFHRWNGRFFLISACLLAIDGLILVWVRGSWVTWAGGLGVSFNGLAILTCATLAYRSARAREFAAHRRWALRLFVVANGVWFMRIFYMAWAIPTGGAGIERTLTGPFDQFIAFGNTLIPLAVLELYLRAERSRSVAARYGTAAVMGIASIVILAGAAGAWMVMWGPYI